MKKNNSEKSEITGAVSVIAHQLKTPLSVIKGFLEALVSGDCGEINSLQKEYLDDALENVERMKKNIDDFLLVQRIEGGKYKLAAKPMSLDDTALKVVSDMSFWAKALNCEIIFKKPKNIPKVLGDFQGIREVIENFISNAIKYSRGRGKIEVSVDLAKNGKEAIFACKDNGINIPQEELNKVFTKFYRSEKAIELDPSGSGLGLYINKIFVEACGGKIWFLKNKDQGMTFYFSLPTVGQIKQKR